LQHIRLSSNSKKNCRDAEHFSKAKVLPLHRYWCFFVMKDP
jgi:hypothetical protein